MAEEPKTSFSVALAAVNKALGDDADEDLDPGDMSVADEPADLGVDEDSDDDEGDEGEEDAEAPEEADEDDEEDAPAVVEEDEPVEEDVEEPDAVAVAAAAEAAKTAAGPATDEFDKLLDELGFRAPKKGQKENRLPQSRVRARMKTALKKYAGTRDAATTDLTTRLTSAQTRITEMDRVDALLAESNTKPENAQRYIEMLAAIHPAFKAYLQPGAAEDRPIASETAVQAAVKKLGAKPGPDIDYKDGTYGYSPEQMEKREDWISAKAAIEAEARSIKALEARFGPMEREYQTAAQARQDAPRIAARLEGLRSLWGPHFIADEKKGAQGSEILTYQRTHRCSFEEATDAVILPKIAADRTAMRQSILAELAGKRKKVAKTAPQATRRAASKVGKRTGIDVVHAALAKHGL